MIQEYSPPYLPFNQDLETKDILKKSISANKELATLNGIAKTLPNQQIIINSLILQEAKDSSEIENIITTHDEVFISNIEDKHLSASTKEVKGYSISLMYGYEQIKKSKLLLIKDIIKIQSLLVDNIAGIRSTAGTTLKNQNNEVIYIPPQHKDKIQDLLSNLEQYINNNFLQDIDPLIKMALIHYQFETIHPFYDGNGRTGRIINILYLVLNDLLDIPILYLSNYIIKNKAKYYQLLRDIKETENYKEWVLFFLAGIEQTSKDTINLINKIKELMEETKQTIKKELPNIYSRDLLHSIFLHPYTKITYLANNLNITRKTASNYLQSLEEIGILSSEKIGRNKYFINVKLFELLKNSNE